MTKKIVFQKWIIEKMMAHLQAPMSKRKNKIFGERIMARVTGEEYKGDQNALIEPTASYKFISELFSAYSEIFESISRMNMSALLIKQYPSLPSWKKAGITKTKYLRYHYENFLHELYMLTERVETMLNLSRKRCQKLKMNDEIELLDKTKNWFYDQLKNALTRRGMHVHQTRYDNSKISQLEILELLHDVNPLSFYRDLYYRNYRLKVSKELSKAAKGVENILEALLSTTTEKVFIKMHTAYQKQANPRSPRLRPSHSESV